MQVVFTFILIVAHKLLYVYCKTKREGYFENMDYGIKLMAGAATKRLNPLDVVTHNIANTNTPGFKAERFRFLKETAGGESNQAPDALKQVKTVDYSQGVIQHTGNVLDLAIKGEGFFAVQGADGIAYTRDGRFTLNKDNELVTLAGDYVLGQKGKISLAGNAVLIDENGGISVDNSQIDVLKMVAFNKSSELIKNNQGNYDNPEDRAEAKEDDASWVQSGYIELSNVQPIREMVEMITIQRTFESYQKVIQTISEQNKMSTSRIGKL